MLSQAHLQPSFAENKFAPVIKSEFVLPGLKKMAISGSARTIRLQCQQLNMLLGIGGK
jgi:hypothetical protein